MSIESGMSCKVRCIVRIRQMIKRWRTKARLLDVPAGHIAVAIGSTRRRFVIPTSHLNHPMFRFLLAKTEEEYGFTNSGLLTIPCDESVFEEILREISRSGPPSNGNIYDGRCGFGVKKTVAFWNDSRPLLRGFADESVY